MRAGKSWTQAAAFASGIFCFFVLAVGAAQGQAVPHYKLDASWPKELPNKWLLANVTGIAVDNDDHIWVLNRPRMLSATDSAAAETPPAAECCVPAPSLVAFDAQGNVVKSWGGPGYVPEWPTLEHGLSIDKEGNFWIGGNFQQRAINQLVAPPWGKPKEAPPGDRQILKFTADGKQLLEIGHTSTNTAPNNQDTSLLGMPSEMAVDSDAHEVYIADGYLNRRIVVYDSNTGAFKRGWGAYGMPLSQVDNGRAESYDPATPAKQFRGPVMGVEISEDGLVYVADAGSNRVQIFAKDGKFVKEFLVHPETLGNFQNGGTTVFGTIMSRDAKQKFLYVADFANGVIRILNRADGSELGKIGHKGRQAGQFEGIECLAMDSHGNIYTSEVGENVRIQKFVPEK